MCPQIKSDDDNYHAAVVTTKTQKQYLLRSKQTNVYIKHELGEKVRRTACWPSRNPFSTSPISCFLISSCYSAATFSSSSFSFIIITIIIIAIIIIFFFCCSFFFFLSFYFSFSCFLLTYLRLICVQSAVSTLKCLSWPHWILRGVQQFKIGTVSSHKFCIQ